MLRGNISGDSSVMPFLALVLNTLGGDYDGSD